MRVRSFFGLLPSRDVGLEMLRAGLATTYEARTGVEWGGREAQYRDAEEKARAARRGIWRLSKKKFESPRQYKNRWAALSAGTAAADAAAEAAIKGKKSKASRK